MAKFEVGDWVIITHRNKPLCIVGRVLKLAKMDSGASAVEVDAIWHYDPLNIDQYQPNMWPIEWADLHVEHCGPPDGAV